MKKFLKKHDFNVRVVSKPAKYLKQVLVNPQRLKKHENCNPCSHLPAPFRCDDKFLVYQFTCKLCNECCIGETCRPFKMRYSEHSKSLASIVLWLNMPSSKHSDVNITITDFDLTSGPRSIENMKRRCDASAPSLEPLPRP